MNAKLAGLGIGVVFGVVLCWTGMANPDVIRGALLVEDEYLFLFFGSAVVTGTIGLQLLKRRGGQAVLADSDLTFKQEKPERRHVYGSALFGLGWGFANACPGPILAQVGEGAGWGFVILAGTVIGVKLYLVRGAKETEPAADEAAPAPEPVAV